MSYGKCNNIIPGVGGLSSRNTPQDDVQKRKIITAAQMKEYGIDLDNFTSLH